MNDRIKRFQSVCTNDEARAYFGNKGLTYSDITDGDILALVMLLNEEIKRSNKEGETSVNSMSLSSVVKTKHKSNGKITSCFLFMNSHYFQRRECISFNNGGWIGFAGWADDGNLNPIRRAFLRWCDALAAAKEVY